MRPRESSRVAGATGGADAKVRVPVMRTMPPLVWKSRSTESSSEESRPVAPAALTQPLAGPKGSEVAVLIRE